MIVWILISLLLMKPADLDLHSFPEGVKSWKSEAHSTMITSNIWYNGFRTGHVSEWFSLFPEICSGSLRNCHLSTTFKLSWSILHFFWCALSDNQPWKPIFSLLLSSCLIAYKTGFTVQYFSEGKLMKIIFLSCILDRLAPSNSNYWYIKMRGLVLKT